MNMISALNRDSSEYLNRMEKYIAELKTIPKELAENEARAALLRSGVITEDGQIKKQIVSYD